MSCWAAAPTSSSSIAVSGVEQQIRWYDEITFILPGGRSSTLKPGALPPPFHAAPSFLDSSVLDLKDKLAIARAMMALVPGLPKDDGENFLSWLLRHGQTQKAIDRFWMPVLVSALNEDLDRMSVRYAAQVFRESFLKSAEAGRMGVPSVPLSQLYGTAADYIEARGRQGAYASCCGFGPRRCRWRAALCWRRGRARRLRDSGDAVQRCREAAAGWIRGRRYAMSCATCTSSPITGIHLWFDREVTPLEHAVLLERTIQWMFQKSKILATRRDSAQSGSYLELVVSASKTLVEKSRAEIIEMAVSELGEFFPAVREATLTKATVIKEVHATFSPTPGSDAFRPSHVSPWPRLFLAGDWTATGWPSTMEGAVRSGYGAAEALSGRKFLVPICRRRD